MTAIVLYTLLFVTLYLEVFFLLSFFVAKRQAADKNLRNTQQGVLAFSPRVAIIVPCWNEEKTVAKTLLSLLALRYPKRQLEIIVVDDGSTDNTFAVAQRFSHDPRVRVFRKENGGKHSAMNFALRKTDAEIIGCLDADSTVAPDALAHLLPHFQDRHVAAVTPAITVCNPRTLIQHMQHAEYALSIFMRKTLSFLDAIFITPGPFSFFRRSALESVGPWRPAHLTEDLEMGLRLQSAGFRIVNEPRALVYTNAPATLKALYRQRLRWSYGFLRNIWEYRHLLFNPRYGNLGLFVLPTALFSLFAALIFTAFALYGAGISLYDTLVRISILGISWPLAGNVDWWFLTPSAMALLAITGIALTLPALAHGKRLIRLPLWHPDIVLYLALYGFIAPVWLFAATQKVLLNSRITWR